MGQTPAAGQPGELGAAGGALSDHRPPATDHGSSDEPPPFGGRWNTLYGVVLGTLAVLIALLYAFTKAFE